MASNTKIYNNNRYAADPENQTTYNPPQKSGMTTKTKWIIFAVIMLILVATGITLAVVLTRKKDTKTGPTKPDLNYGGSSKNPEYLPLTDDKEKVKRITNELNEALKDENIQLSTKDTKILLDGVVNHENLSELKKVIKDALFNDEFEELRNTIKKLITKVKKNLIANKDLTNEEIKKYIKTNITDDKINQVLDEIFKNEVMREIKKHMKNGLKANVEVFNNLLASENINCRVTIEDYKIYIMAQLEAVNMAFIEALVEESNVFKAEKKEDIQIPINAIKTFLANVKDYLDKNLTNNSLKNYIDEHYEEVLTTVEKNLKEVKEQFQEQYQVAIKKISKEYTTTTKKINNAINN